MDATVDISQEIIVKTPLLKKEYKYRQILSMIKERTGQVVHSSLVAVPSHWSQTAGDILSQKYIRKAGVPVITVAVQEEGVFTEFARSEAGDNPEIPFTEQLGGETSAHQVFHRLAGCWTYWGIKSGYFKTRNHAIDFYNDTYDALYNQIAAPNSPQWFNTGLNWAYGIKSDASTSPLYYYDLDTKKVEKSKYSYMNPQVHACQPARALISTPKGPIKIGTVVKKNLIGLEVFDREGTTKVVAVADNGKKEVFRVELSNSNYIEATADHQILVVKDYYHNKAYQTFEYIRLDELEVGMRLVQRNNTTIELNKVSDVELAEAFLVGFLQGDGFQSRTMYSSPVIEFMTVTSEEHTAVMSAIEKVFVGKHYKIRDVKAKNNRLEVKRIRLYGKHLLHFLDKYALRENRWGVNLRVPAKIMQGGFNTVQQYLRALFQADGSVRKGSVSLNVISLDLLHDVQKLLFNFGIYSRINEGVAKGNKQAYHSLFIKNKSERQKFFDKVGFITSDKIEKLQETLKYQGKAVPDVKLETIVDIKSLGRERVYDIQTASENYLSNNVVVHNCFIQSISDHLIASGGIMDLAYREAAVFKFGSGSGSNFSKLRAKGEKLSSGGISSGLMSFLKIGDTSAGSIKSGGTTRRAAKLIAVDVDHPEIEDYIALKVREENKVAALVTGSMLNRQYLSVMRDAKTENELNIAGAEALDAGVPGGLVQRAMQAWLSGVKFDVETYDVDWQGEAYGTVTGQNANNSVTISDDFMAALEKDGDWNLTARTDGRVMKTVKAKKLWQDIAFAAWASADPAVLYTDTMNKWNTCINDERIIACNPCAEYHWFDDTACNLASLNIVAIWEQANKNVKKFMELLGFYARLFTTVLDISIQMAQFVSHAIAEKTHIYRTTGLGYANIGSFLMRQGLAYGSDEGNAVIAGITSIMTANAYLQSHRIAKELGSFPAYERNKDAFTEVMILHRSANYKCLLESPRSLLGETLLNNAQNIWADVVNAQGFRNAQTVVIAPTGTISLIMDTDTTGIEPDFSLVKHKKLAGGGYLKLINQAVPEALLNLGYSQEETDATVAFISGAQTFPHINSLDPLTARVFTEKALMQHITNEDLLNFGVSQTIIDNLDFSNFYDLDSILNHLQTESQVDLSVLRVQDEKFFNTQTFIFGFGNIDDCAIIKDHHKPIFACAVSAKPDGLVIDPMSHLKAMASAQPFVSGAISKTINMPNSATVQDIADIYLWAHKNGLKAVSVYRDGSKLSQPLMASVAEKLTKVIKAIEPAAEIKQERVENVINLIATRHVRRRLPNKRRGYTQKATIAGHNLYIRTGEYEDGTLGEIFLDMHKEGAAFRAVMHSFAIAVSIGLQYGVPLEEFCDAFVGTRFEPAGFVKGHDNIRMGKSLIDYVFRDIGFNYLNRHEYVEEKPKQDEDVTDRVLELASVNSVTTVDKKSDGGVVIRHIPVAVKASSIYTGDTCSSCGSTRMKSTGTCATCEECGTTSGCS